jgi:hypothetical protein
MPGIIESIRDRIAGVKAKPTDLVNPSKSSTSGMLKNRDEYNAYVEDMAIKGKKALTFAQWSGR